MPDILADYKYFIGFITFTLLLIIGHYGGQRRNMKKIRETARSLEKILSPSQKTYTWLGGVVGFHADFKVEGFKEVKAVLTLLPRQSFLFLPLSLLKGTKDKLQVLFFLNTQYDAESHILPLSGKRPFIYNRETLKSVTKKHGGMDVEILYQKNPSIMEDMISVISQKLHMIRHIAFTPENSIVYVEIILASTTAEMEELLSKIAVFLRTGL